MAVVYRCVGILTVDVVFFRSCGVFHSQDSFPSMFCPWLWQTSSGVVAVGVFAAVARSDDIDSQDSNTPIDHGHLARNCLIKITTPAAKASVISFLVIDNKRN